MKPPNDPSKIRPYATVNMSLLYAYNEQVHNQLKELGFAAEGIVSLTREQWDDAVKVVPNLWEVLKTAVAERNAYAAQREEERKAEQEAAKSLEAGARRLQEYFNSGLVASKENAAIFQRAWREHPQLGKITQSSPEIVDAVIAVCRDKLTWRKPEPTPAPTPAVRMLPNGEPELRLDASEAEMRRASIAQLRDLSKRRGEGQSWFNRQGRIAGNLDVGSRQSQVI